MLLVHTLSRNHQTEIELPHIFGSNMYASAFLHSTHHWQQQLQFSKAQGGGGSNRLFLWKPIEQWWVQAPFPHLDPRSMCSTKISSQTMYTNQQKGHNTAVTGSVYRLKCPPTFKEHFTYILGCLLKKYMT